MKHIRLSSERTHVSAHGACGVLQGLVIVMAAAAFGGCSEEPRTTIDASPGSDAGPPSAPEAGALRTDAGPSSALDGGFMDASSDASQWDAEASAAADARSDTGASRPATNTCRGPASVAIANARLPTGYCAWTWANVADPRGLLVAPNGDVLVVERQAGRISALFDGDNDGVSSASERVTLVEASGLNHGIALHDGYLYASSATTVFRWPYTTGARAALSGQQVVVSGIPTGGHSTRTLIFDAQDRLYVSVGSNSNVDPDSSRARIRRFSSAQVEAGAVSFNDGEVFADGLRNEVGLRFDPQGRLWGVENERDNLNRPDLGGDIHTDNPGEELNLFAETGKFYGYPYCFSEFLLPAGVGMGPRTQWADPRFMNDGTHTDAWCRDINNVVPPALVLPAHVAPLDIVFYDGASFPADVIGDAFVSFHGSWNRQPAQGYEVRRVVFESGAPVRYESFFEFNGQSDTAPAWPHRPVGLAVGANGQLFVSSDASAQIIAIGYQP
jgi:glucose/arabinose dehydrogenase